MMGWSHIRGFQMVMTGDEFPFVLLFQLEEVALNVFRLDIEKLWAKKKPKVHIFEALE